MLILQIAAGIVFAFGILFAVVVVIAFLGSDTEGSPDWRFMRSARGRYLPSDAPGRPTPEP